MSLDFLNNTGGWDALNQASAPMTEEQAEAARASIEAAMLEEYENASAVAAAFASGPGARVLALMRQHTVDKPVIVANGSMVEQIMDLQITPSEWMWLRAGQNSVIHWIEAQIQKAHDGPPQFEDDEQGVDDDGS